MPKSLRARPAEDRDYAFYASLVPLLRSGDAPTRQDVWSRSIRPESFVYERDQLPVAYAWAQPLKPCAYVKNVMVTPGAQGQGVGHFVMEHLRGVLLEAGATEWVLNVKPDNLPAMKLYAAVGMKTEYASTALRLSWAVVDALPEAPAEVTGTRFSPADDEAMEREFGLPKGQLSSARSDDRYLLLRLEDERRVAQGLARFDPSFPGAFPFRVRRIDCARALLEAMRSHARAELSYVQVVVEDDAPLTELLRTAGAETRLEMLHLRGKLD